MERRKTTLWLKYNDMTFFVYRQNRESPISIAKFSRIGLQRDFWKIGTVIKGIDNIIIARDKGESNGPSHNRTGVIYIHVPPNKIIYHEMDTHGNTFKMKVYEADQDLRVVDFVAISRQVYIISPDRLFKYLVNEDSLRKEEQLSDIKENEYKQVGMTIGGIFLFVKRFKGGERLFANDKFETKDGHLHLEGRRVQLKNSGDQNYVVWVEGLSGKGKYYYVKNKNVTKGISLVFNPIEEIDREYANVVEFKDRIHFYEGLSHAVYIKGAKTGVLNIPTSFPIVGIWYESTYQLLEEDRVLFVRDKLEEALTSQGILHMIPIELSKPRVVCVNERDSIEQYLKFIVYTRDIKYRFSVKINGQGGSLYERPTIFVMLWCLAIAFFVVLISYCCKEKAKVDRLKAKADFRLGNMEVLDAEDHENSMIKDKTQIYDSDEEEIDEFQNGLNISL